MKNFKIQFRFKIQSFNFGNSTVRELRKFDIMSKLLCLFLCCSQVFGQQLNNRLDSLMLKNFPSHQPGAALLVAKNGKVLYAKGFGITGDKSGKEQLISAITNFRMASVSKQFTAMCIVKLVKQHKISLNDNLQKFFPGWNKKIAALITVKQLLSHSSGIWDYEDLIPANQKEQVSDASVVSYLLQKDTLYFKPGSAFRYSNSGFCVLEQIIEKASGLTYPEFCLRYIFKPLGMVNTTIYKQGKKINHRSLGFAKDSTGAIFESDQSLTSATMGDGGVYTSLNDYLKWATALISNKSFNINHYLQQINYCIKNNQAFYYGLGWFNTTDIKNGLTLYHSGSTCGFSNVVKIMPGSKMVVAYFSNIADNHAVFNEAESILKQSGIDKSAIDFNRLIDLTR